ncbi:hypothetical protein [Nocardia transvalensis]|uniref:hypothetical protein n=1 Tax=Nocardia transvalensis TaxID=37333 RepID=UPI001895B8E6|nr:hypothetical protein [Nocardia transvalensis]
MPDPAICADLDLTPEWSTLHDIDPELRKRADDTVDHVADGSTTTFGLDLSTAPNQNTSGMHCHFLVY